MKLIALLVLFSLFSCNPSHTTDIAQLKQDILNKACDAELRQYLSDRIKKLELALTQNQLIKNLNDIRDDLNCE